MPLLPCARRVVVCTAFIALVGASFSIAQISSRPLLVRPASYAARIPLADRLILSVNLGIGLNAVVTASNIVCYNINIPVYHLDGMKMQSTFTSDDNATTTDEKPARHEDDALTFSASLTLASLTCQLDYSYESMLANGTGQALLGAIDNELTIAARIIVGGQHNDSSQNETVLSSRENIGTAAHANATTASIGTTLVSVDSCRASIRIATLDFVTIEPMAALLQSVVVTSSTTTTDETSSTSSIALVLADAVCHLLETTPSTLDVFLGTIPATMPLMTKADPLDAETSLTATPLLYNGTNNSESVQLVNFQANAAVPAEAKWPDWGFVTALNLAAAHLGTDNDVDDGIADLNVNRFLQEFILDDTGRLVLNLPLNMALTTTFNGTDLLGRPSSLTFRSVHIFGLDRWTRFDVGVMGRYTLQANVSVDAIDVRLMGTLNVPLANVHQHDVEISMRGNNVNMSTALLVAMDAARVAAVPLGATFLDVKSMLSCLLPSTLYRLAVADTIVESMQIAQPESALSAVLLEAAGIFIGVDTVAQQVVHGILTKLNELSSGGATTCTSLLPKSTHSDTPFVDFRDLLLAPSTALAHGGHGTAPYGKLIPWVKSYVDRQLFDNFIVPFTKAQSGTAGSLELDEAITLLDHSVRGSSLNSRIGLYMRELSVESLHSVTAPIEFLQPVNGSSFALLNAMSLTKLRASGVLRLNLTATGLFHETLAVRFGIDIDGVRLAATLMARMLEKSVGEFPVRDVLNVHCWLATIPPLLVGSSQSLSFQDLKISLGDIGVQLDCIDCRSTMSRTTIEGISTAFSSQSQSLNGHITSIASHFLRDEALMRWLRNAPTQCPHHRDYKPVTTNAVSNAPVTETVTKTSQSDDISILIGISAMVACLVVACLAAMTHLRKRQQTSKSGEATTTATASPLFISDQVPKMTKWLVPTFVLASILLSIAGFTEDSFHMLLSANIVELDLFQMDMHFSMLELAAEAWQGNNTGFTTMLILVSFVGPAMTNICTLSVWLAPLDKKQLLRYPWWLKNVVKWNMCFAFVMIISTAAFGFRADSTIQSTDGTSLYRINAFLQPSVGIVYWVIGHVLSQAVLAVVCHYSRAAITGATKSCATKPRSNTESSSGTANGSQEMSDDTTRLSSASPISTLDSCDATDRETAPKPSALCKETFMHHLDGETELVRVRNWVNPTVAVVGLITAVFGAVGCIAPIVTFHHSGVVNELAGREQETHSIYSLLQLDTHGSVGASLAILTALVVTIVPMLHVAILMIQWFCPMEVYRLKITHRIARAIQNLQYTEVFLVALVLCTFHLSTASTSIAGRYCEGFAAVFFALESIGILPVRQGASCYAVSGSIHAVGATLLITSCCLLHCLRLFVTDASYQRLIRQEQASAHGSNKESNGVVWDKNPSSGVFAQRYRAFLRTVRKCCDEAVV